MSSRLLITAPAAYPLTLQEVKDQLRVTDTAEDNKLNMFLAAATAHTENYLSRALISQTWDFYLDNFPPDGRVIELPLPPAISITSIKYFDENDVEQTWDSALYTVNLTGMYNAEVYPAVNGSYPSSRYYRNSVVTRAVVGYADSGADPVDLADNVPDAIKHAILLLIGHMWENREATTFAGKVMTVPYGYESMLTNYKLYSF